MYLLQLTFSSAQLKTILFVLNKKPLNDEVAVIIVANNSIITVINLDILA